VNISKPVLGNNDNHRKKVEAVEALLESASGATEKRGTNTNSVTKVSTKK